MPMNPLDLIPDKFRVLALVIAIFASFASGTTIGWTVNGWRLNADHQQEEKERQAEQNKLLLRHAEEVAQIQIENDAKNRKVSDDYENRLAVLRKARAADRAAVDAAGGLRVPDTICRGAAGQTEAAGNVGRNETLAGTLKLPDRVEDFLWGEADRADEIVEQARACQQWITTHGFYGGSE